MISIREKRDETIVIQNNKLIYGLAINTCLLFLTFSGIFNILKNNIVQVYLDTVLIFICHFLFRYFSKFRKKTFIKINSQKLEILSTSKRRKFLLKDIKKVQIEKIKLRREIPYIVKLELKNERKKVKRVIEKGLNMLSFLIVPSTVILFGYAHEIVRLIYKRGNFSDKSVIITAETLQFYAIGLLFFSTIHLLTRSHYVYKDRTLPVISSFISIGCNILLDNLLYRQYAHIGLTFATSFAAFVNFTILFVSLNKRHIRINNIKYLLSLLVAFGFSMAAFHISRYINTTQIGKFGILVNVLIFSVVYLVLWVIIFTIRKILLPKKKKKK